MSSCRPVTIVRPARADDADGIAHVHVEAARTAYRGLMPDDYLESVTLEARTAQWREWLSKDDGDADILVAEGESGDIAGIVAVGPDKASTRPETGELRMINVAPSAWGSGIGADLLRAGEQRLRDLGYDEAVLWVIEKNSRARRFYEREGWAFDGAVEERERPGFVLRLVRYRRDLG